MIPTSFSSVQDQDATGAGLLDHALHIPDRMGFGHGKGLSTMNDSAFFTRSI
jgi:hypothetical protein